jgi:hypothetical protein
MSSEAGAGGFARRSYPAFTLNIPTPARRAAFSSLSFGMTRSNAGVNGVLRCLATYDLVAHWL